MSLKVSEPSPAVSDAALKTTVAKPDFRSACGRVLSDIRKGGGPHPLPRPALPQTFTSPGGRFVIHYTTAGADAAYDASSTAVESVVSDGDPLAEVLATLDPSTGVPA